MLVWDRVFRCLSPKDGHSRYDYCRGQNSIFHMSFVDGISILFLNLCDIDLANKQNHNEQKILHGMENTKNTEKLVK